MNQAVCAVIVTYNRKLLLRECLGALSEQSVPLGHTIVVNNASTDGTEEMVREEFPGVEFVNLGENRGGAGGFNEGLKRAQETESRWVWIMDDDSIPLSDALQKLLEVSDSCRVGGRSPVLLASRVVWADGDLHPMNKPTAKLESESDVFEAVQQSVLPIRSASFVSILVDNDISRRYGLPYADYFIWNDDVEYTARILRSELGVWVPASEVLHKTEKKHVGPNDVRVARYYYSLRNRLWMVKSSDAWGFREKCSIVRSVAGIAWHLLSQNRMGFEALSIVARGIKDGLFTSPKN